MRQPIRQGRASILQISLCKPRGNGNLHRLARVRAIGPCASNFRPMAPRLSPSQGTRLLFEDPYALAPSASSSRSTRRVVENVMQVILDRLFADEEFFADFAVA